MKKRGGVPEGDKETGGIKGDGICHLGGGLCRWDCHFDRRQVPGTTEQSVRDRIQHADFCKDFDR